MKQWAELPAITHEPPHCRDICTSLNGEAQRKVRVVLARGVTKGCEQKGAFEVDLKQ